MLKKGRVLLLAAALVLAFAQAALPALTAVGPVNPTNGFPVWYRDSLGQTVTLSVPPSPLSIPDNDPVLDGFPVNPFALQIGFNSEAMYWHSTATMDPVSNPGVPGDALLVLALEAAFAQGDAANGDQMVFARVRIRIDTTVAGDVTVTHPYGARTYQNVQPGNRSINDTIDIGAVPLNFNAARVGDIGPFLKQVGAPPGSLGDAATLAPVTGSPTGNNFFRVNGGGWNNAQTNLFVTGAELFTGVPFKVTQSTVSVPAVGGATAQVFANFPRPIPAGSTITAGLPGQAAVPLVRQGATAVFAALIPWAAPAFPANVTVTGTIAGPPVQQTILTAPLKDVVTITKATYAIATRTLTVAAVSSVAVNPPALRAFFPGAGAAGRLLNAGGADTVIANVNAPVSVTVRSALGGAATIQTTLLP